LKKIIKYEARKFIYKMAYYLPSEIIAKLTTFEVSFDNGLSSISHKLSDDLRYKEVRNENLLEYIGNIILSIQMYSTTLRYNFFLEYTKNEQITQLLFLREYINTSSNLRYFVRLGQIDAGVDYGVF
jgi:hypothetical protein